ncbi:hypothetical protein B0H10DRAFT_477862 [Mycena sp. CBHHK59/15]|nr:hypothetical protein B0H10DRAFT_477862 [Mycena sp. CBHHK59/15]
MSSTSTQKSRWTPSRPLCTVWVFRKSLVHFYFSPDFSPLVIELVDWWRHKQMHYWIIPCLVKSESSIPADVWDSTPSTTNTNEAQHHWTNTLTGIKLTPVEGLESRRVVDQNVAREIEMSLETGILSNPNNEISHRMAGSSQRQSNAARKSRESRQAADISKELQLQINAEAEKRRVSNELTKSLKEQLNAAKGKSGKGGKADGKSVILSASSSGRVKTARARTVVPMPVHAIQSDDASSVAGGAPIPVHETQLDIIPSATIAPTTAPSSEAPMAEFQPPAPSDSTFDFLSGMDFDFNWLAQDLAGANNETSHWRGIPLLLSSSRMILLSTPAYLRNLTHSYLRPLLPRIPFKISWICMGAPALSLTLGPPLISGRSMPVLLMSRSCYFLQPHPSRLLP